MTKLEEFEYLFWKQYPIEGTARFDGNFIVELLQEISPRYNPEIAE